MVVNLIGLRNPNPKERSPLGARPARILRVERSILAEETEKKSRKRERERIGDGVDTGAMMFG